MCSQSRCDVSPCITVTPLHAEGLSDIGSFRELWQDAALFVPADDPLAARAAINRLIDEPDLRLRLRAGAQARAGAYTQEACVSGTLAVYRRVIDETRSIPLATPLQAAG